MKKTFVVIALAIPFAVGINSCKHVPDYADFIRDSTSVSTNCDPDTVYYDNDIQPLLTSSCGIQGCHDAGTREEGISVANYADVINSKLVVPNRPDKSDIIEVITSNNSDKVMPPPPRSKLTSEQVALINKWISQGARNNKCTSDCDSSQFKFAANVKPLIDNVCKGCHSGTFPSGGIALTNYGEIKAQADNGKLVGSISFQQGYKAMPDGGPKMSDCKVAVIRKWVQAGAPNN